MMGDKNAMANAWHGRLCTMDIRDNDTFTILADFHIAFLTER
jgi:hypothetical protein